MSDSLSYVCEKFGVAVEVLATSTGTIQERVAEAYESGLYLLQSKEIPVDLRADFDRLKQALRTHPKSETESAWMVSARQLETEEARDLAKLIVRLDGEVHLLDEESRA